MLEITDQTQTDRLLANGYIEATFWKDLKVKLNMGIDKNQGRRSTYLPKSTLYGKQEGGKAPICCFYRISKSRHILKRM